MSKPMIKRLIDLKFYYVDIIKLILDEHNLIITTKIKKRIYEFMVSLINLKIIMEKLAKINNNERLDMRKAEKNSRKSRNLKQKKSRRVRMEIKI